MFLIYVNALFFLIIAIVTGGYWSYLQLVWGNWWTWDSIENALLCLFIMHIILLHFQGVRNAKLFLFGFNYLLVLILLFILIRFGFIQSKHSFFGTIAISTLWSLALFTVIFISFLSTSWYVYIISFLPIKGAKVNYVIFSLLNLVVFNFLTFVTSIYLKCDVLQLLFLGSFFIVIFILLYVCNTITFSIVTHLVTAIILLVLYFYKMTLYIFNINFNIE